MNITTDNSKILLALNKPKGYIVTRSDELGRKLFMTFFLIGFLMMSGCLLEDLI